LTDIADRDGDDESFQSFQLDQRILQSLTDLGYETPTPIQRLTIPLLLEGRDLIGQAQTGTGKTAAFALPLLNQVDIEQTAPQVLVLAPTRELALQVCQAMKGYGKHLKKLKILPVYGGQGMTTQLSALRRGVHVVVGTPGRLLDHLDRGTLKLDAIKALVLDEADEMLRMGFIEEVEKIMENLPPVRQTALFSATMPPRIAQIAKRFLKKPAEVRTKTKSNTVDAIKQYFVQVRGEAKKFDALCRILEGFDYDGVIVFVRTRISTVEVAEKLERKGFAAQALNGDLTQALRQRTVDRFKRKEFDVLVCTDVAARGLDVPRISHVLNFDIPFDSEIYVHRIGRTGRAGRDGTAILFALRRDFRRIETIERKTRSTIERMTLPTAEQVKEKRIRDFKLTLSQTIESQKLDDFVPVVESFAFETERDMETIAAALTYLLQKDRPFKVREIQAEPPPRAPHKKTSTKKLTGSRDDRSGSSDGPRPSKKKTTKKVSKADTTADRGSAAQRGKGDGSSEVDSTASQLPKPKRKRGASTQSFDRPKSVYRVEVGNAHGLEPRHLVGAIANEAGLESSYIGSIRIAEEHSVVELPSGMPKEVLTHLKQVWVCERQLKMSYVSDVPQDNPPPKRLRPSRTRKQPPQSKSKKTRRKTKKS